MTDTFREEIETQEQLDKLQRKILKLENLEGEESDMNLMITFNPNFQIKVETFTTVKLYQRDHSRSCFGWTWFSNMGQEEPFIVWKKM